MLSLHRSSNRWFSVIMIAVFMLFATPTPSLEINPNESVRGSSQGFEYSTNMAARKNASVLDSKRFTVFALFVISGFMLNALRARSEARVSFRPQIARRLTRLLLSPIRYTSIYV
ncbi:hypothetical protein [Paenibacillus piri]|uniref:Uncharacterized protein n=1 Tax=Paenibacillus piri TaxID=2547395 RepID=A0A4R5KUB7_9BACL|nr:hypothetical protein [Paenibacillus piri]TDF98635.1 hypothetical protein E1757_08825 [Paenibacillus piri]